MNGRTEAVIRMERELLRALIADAPKGRPELQRRLARVTEELLKFELNRPLPSVPEHPDVDGHELRHWQK